MWNIYVHKIKEIQNLSDLKIFNHWFNFFFYYRKHSQHYHSVVILLLLQDCQSCSKSIKLRFPGNQINCFKVGYVTLPIMRNWVKTTTKQFSHFARGEGELQQNAFMQTINKWSFRKHILVQREQRGRSQLLTDTQSWNPGEGTASCSSRPRCGLRKQISGSNSPAAVLQRPLIPRGARSPILIGKGWGQPKDLCACL